MIFDWIKRLFDKDRPIKKEVGGFEILDGVVLGASYFSKDGKQSSALICPPIWAFNYGITNSLNRLNSVTLPPEEFQSTFNSLLDDFVAEILVYLENRRKLRSSYPCAGAQGARRAEVPLRTPGSHRSLADSLTALLHGETIVSPTHFADPPFIPA